MERVKQFYRVTLLDEEYTLTADDFHKFQKECSEIAAFKSRGATGCTRCQHQDQDTSEFDHVADEPEIMVELAQGGLIPSERVADVFDNREFLLTKSPHKAISEVVTTALTPKLDADVVKEKVEKMAKPPTKAKRSGPALKKDVTKYARMIQAGDHGEAVKNMMARDQFCAVSSINYFYLQAQDAVKDLPAVEKTKPASFVTIVKNDLTEEQILNACYAANHSQIPVEHCKEIAGYGYDLDAKEVVFRGSGLGKYDHKEIIAVYEMTHPEVAKV